MHKHQEPPDTSHGYELTDLSISDITKGVIGFFIFTVACGFIGLLFLWGLFSMGIGSPTEAVSSRARVVPVEPNPMVQTETTAKMDIYNLRYKEQQAIEGKMPSAAGGANSPMPISEAMEKVAGGNP